MAPWLTYKAVKLVKRKHRQFAKYKSNDHPAYRIAAKNANIEVRRAKLNFKKKLAQNIKKDTKSLYAYVRNKSKSL